MKRKEGGFTIVEVVIAVTVIGVLLIIAIATFNGLTAKGRDATRRARAEAMALDLERYYKYNTTSRGHEYPSGNVLLADIGKYFSDTTVVQDPSRPGSRLVKGCTVAGPIPASWGWTDEQKMLYRYCAQDRERSDCDKVYGASGKDVCVGFRIYYYSESDNALYQVNSIWSR